MGSEKYVLGIDGGTGGIRAGLFAVATGEPIAFADTPYDTSYPKPGHAEQSPSDWWNGLGASSRKVLRESGIDPRDVAGVCVDTTCCTVVALDADANALRPAILWMDMRASDQTKQVLATRDPALSVNGDGAGPVSAEWMIPKALWLAQCEPETFRDAAMICEYQDYVNVKLTGRYCGSANNVAVRWHFVDGRGPPTSLLKSLNIPELLEKWPKDIVGLGDVVGALTRDAATHLGLPAGVPVAQGGADAFVAMVGLGTIEPGQLALITGSSHLHLGVTDRRFHGRGIWGTYSCALVGGHDVVEGGQTSTGSVVNWFKTLCGGGDGFYDEVNAAAAEVPPGCEGLVVQEHLQGNRTPHTDPLSRGVVSGLTLRHGRAHVFSAILEGISFGTRLIFDAMEANGYKPSEVVVAGGATRSDLWLQIHADVANVPFKRTKCADAPALGAAILAAVCAGCYATVADAARAMVHMEGVVHPRPEVHAQYARAYAAYKATYPALRRVIHRQGSEAAFATSVDDDDDDADAATDETPVAKIAPSLLAADQGDLAGEVSRMIHDGADWLHVDIMDGHFVNNLTIGPPVVAHLRARARDAFLDCHLSCSNPGSLIDGLAAARASSVTFHIEAVGGGDGDGDATSEAAALAATIRARGMRAAVALKPSTPIETVFPLVDADAVDMVLCLTVEPGFGGQKFTASVCDKVRALRRRRPRLDIQVDGGLNEDTVVAAARAGANVVVAGSAVFGSDDPGRVIRGLRRAVVDARRTKPWLG